MLATTGASLSDPSLVLLQIELHDHQVQNHVANENIAAAREDIELAQAELQRARERLREAQEHSGFWGKCSGVLKGDIATLAAVVAATAAVVATGGAGAAVVAVCAAGLSAGAKVGEKVGLPKGLCTGMALGGAALGVCTGNVSGLSTLGTTIYTGARCVQAGATAAGGVADGISAKYESNAINARADTKQIEIGKQDAEEQTSDELDALKRASIQKNRTLDLVMSIRQGRDESRMALLSNIGGT